MIANELLLKPGQELSLADSAGEVTVGPLLGSGGQGQVYQAHVFGRDDHVVKWYLPQHLLEAPGLWNRLNRIIQLSPPSRAFLWPYARVIKRGASSSRPSEFGYLMPRRNRDFLTFNQLLYEEVERSFRLLLRIGFMLTNNMRLLHLSGLCYRDLNLGNFFYHPGTGEIEITDNDNVDIEGADTPTIGTPEFTSPEILRGTTGPSRYTDLWSLAVLLFYITMLRDPFEGKMSAQSQFENYNEDTRRALRRNPIFIFHPDDHSNEPMHGNQCILWPRYPGHLRDLFTRSFTSGADSLRARVTWDEWQNALLHVYDSIFRCAECGTETLADFGLPAEAKRACFSCQKALGLPPSLRLGPWRIALVPGARVYPHHLERLRNCDFGRPVGEVFESPLALKNLTRDKWTAEIPQVGIKAVVPGEKAPIIPGMRIHFATQTGEALAGIPAA
jgi:serine/threonine protein kinase